MKFKIVKAPAPPPVPPPHEVGDILVYTPNGNLYLLGKKTTRDARQSPLFDYLVFNPESQHTCAGRSGSFDSKNFVRFEGSITLSNN